MADPIEELIKEIAAKHGIAVSRDDPILILQTINTRLLQESAKAQQAMLISTRRNWKPSRCGGGMMPGTRRRGS
jgi:hypothetical protein